MEKKPHFSPWHFFVGLLVMLVVQTSLCDDVLAMIDRKIRSGKVCTVTESPRGHERVSHKSADVMGLMALPEESIDNKQLEKRRAAS